MQLSLYGYFSISAFKQNVVNVYKYYTLYVYFHQSNYIGTLMENADSVTVTSEFQSYGFEVLGSNVTNDHSIYTCSMQRLFFTAFSMKTYKMKTYETRGLRGMDSHGNL